MLIVKWLLSKKVESVDLKVIIIGTSLVINFVYLLVVENSISIYRTWYIITGEVSLTCNLKYFTKHIYFYLQRGTNWFLTTLYNIR